MSYREKITAEAIHAIIQYIDEGEPDFKVVRAELGEVLLRNSGEYFHSNDGDTILYRPHRGCLSESLSEMVEFSSIEEMLSNINKCLLGSPLSQDAIEFKSIGLDERTGWQTYIVIGKGYGVLGYTNGLFKQM